MSEPRWVADEEALAEVVEAVAAAERYAVDTEFHRERTYYPQVALVQMAWLDQVVLIDPLAVDLKPLSEVFDGPGIAVMHAAGQDLEVMAIACGTVPSVVFDTQLAAGFVGHVTPSLAALVERELGVGLPKGDRLTDWLVRPLSADQRSYAASDVTHLLELHDRLTAQLEELGRLSWALDECEEHRSRGRELRDPEDAWLRIKEARHLRGAPVGVAQAVAAWRERRAAAIDQPVRFVLPDLGVVGIAQRMPRTRDQLRGIRGLDDRHLRGRVGDEILEVVARGRDNPVDRPRIIGVPEVERQLRPAVTLVSAWLGQLGRELHIDPVLLGTRADIEALLCHAADARLAERWRAELVGEPIRRLVAGKAALAFDGNGGLVLEERSGRRIR